MNKEMEHNVEEAILYILTEARCAERRMEDNDMEAAKKKLDNLVSDVKSWGSTYYPVNGI